MEDYIITPEQGKEAYDQTQFLINNAPEILFKYMNKPRRKEIEAKLGVSISKARKMLLGSRIYN